MKFCDFFFFPPGTVNGRAEELCEVNVQGLSFFTILCSQLSEQSGVVMT